MRSSRRGRADEESARLGNERGTVSERKNPGPPGQHAGTRLAAVGAIAAASSLVNGPGSRRAGPRAFSVATPVSAETAPAGRLTPEQDQVGLESAVLLPVKSLELVRDERMLVDSRAGRPRLVRNDSLLPGRERSRSVDVPHADVLPLAEGMRHDAPTSAGSNSVGLDAPAATDLDASARAAGANARNRSVVPVPRWSDRRRPREGGAT